MSTRSRMVGTGMGMLAVIGGVTGVAAATATSTGDVDDDALTGDTLSRAVAAATAAVEGTVVDTETGDDGAAYGVEIQRPDGSVVEVQIDSAFTVTGTEADDDGTDGPDDDADGVDDD
jgi:uncharacterized membrane protein YkoI